MNEFILKRTAYLYNLILNSKSGKYARQYLQKRGISLAIANNFLIGATSPLTGNGHISRAVTHELIKHINAYDLMESRIVKIHDNNNILEMVDYFGKGRLIFPIMKHGKPTYFISRSVANDNKYRYLNMHNKPVDSLFNQDILKSTHEKIYITEGIMDALTLESIGRPAIATLGTSSLRPDHRTLFEHINKQFIFVFDADKNQSGDKAVLRSASMLKSFGINSLFKIVLPRKSGQKKVDINQLLIRANDTNTLKEWFDKREPEIVHVEAHQPSIGNDIEQKPSIEIYKVVSRYVNLKPINSILYRGLCPLHDDKEPSLHVYTESNTFKCFGCGKWGDAAQFLQDLQGLSYSESLEKISSEF